MAGQGIGGDRVSDNRYLYKGPNHKCKDCQKRHYACHDTCEDYINARKEWDERLREIRKTKHVYKDVIGHQVETVIKVTKDKRR